MRPTTEITTFFYLSRLVVEHVMDDREFGLWEYAALSVADRRLRMNPSSIINLTSLKIHEESYDEVISYLEMNKNIVIIRWQCSKGWCIHIYKDDSLAYAILFYLN